MPTLDAQAERALELEREGLALERRIHEAMTDEARLYDAMRDGFHQRLEASDLGAIYPGVIRRRMKARADRLAAERAGG